MGRLEDLGRHPDLSATCMAPALYTIQLEAPVWEGSHGRDEGPPSEKHTGCDFRIPLFPCCDPIVEGQTVYTSSHGEPKWGQG